MSTLATLKAATSIHDVANLLGFRASAVSYVLYRLPAARKYTTFQIPKRNGGERTISAPVDALKLMQRRLSDLLQNCVDEINIENKRKSRAVHGFKRKRSIISNARQHRRRRWVFNLDLEDFFPSINFGRVRGFFMKNRDFELHEAVATIIAQVACNDNTLPQGSPCSPVISNLVTQFLDIRLVKLASDAGCTYSRYADDLTFSTNKKVFPEDIAIVQQHTEGNAAHSWMPGHALQEIIERSGFRINVQKTRMMYRTSRLEVTGLVVNKKISVRMEYRHNVRAMVRRLVTTGSFEIFGATEEDGHLVLKKRPGTLDELRGMLGFIDSVHLYNRTHTTDSNNHKMSSSEKVYRDFLLYSLFYAAQMPVVICEGQTDNVYLTHAIRSLVADFPDLAEVLPDNKIRLKLRLFKYHRSSTGRLLGLNDGGSGVLRNFVSAYTRETRHFTGPGLTNPVVVVYDNDEGATGIRSTIRKVAKVPLTDEMQFVHVAKNVYAVPTPGADSKIEDFFDAATQAVTIGGKTFNPGSSIDRERHYGKTIFAHKVVRPNADTIDFGGFRPLLTNLAAAINSHKTLAAPQSL